MAWARIDDNMPDHPKLARLGVLRPLAGWLHVCGLCYAARYLTDGFVPSAQVPSLTRFDHVGYETGGVPGMFSVGEDADPFVLVDALVKVGMWHQVRGGYQIHDYLEYNPSREKALQKRADNAARVERFRLRNAQRNALPDGSPTPAPTPVTTTKISSKSLVANGSRPTHDPASELLEFLNRKSGHRYRPVKSTLDMIRARLASGASADQVRWVIAAKCREWRDDPDRAKYLRPETLFRASKFESYLGQLPNLTPHEEV